MSKKAHDRILKTAKKMTIMKLFKGASPFIFWKIEHTFSLSGQDFTLVKY